MKAPRLVPQRIGLLLCAGLLLACTAETSPSINENSEPPLECHDCSPPAALPWNAADELSAVHRQCGLTLKNVVDEHWVVVEYDDPQAERKLSCLAAAGEHEVIGRFADVVIRAGHRRQTEISDEDAYRWAMIALRNYLRSVGIDYDREDFFEAYRRLGEQPGPVNANGPSDRIYYHSDVPLKLIEEDRIKPSAADARRLETIRRNRPSYP